MLDTDCERIIPLIQTNEIDSYFFGPPLHLLLIILEIRGINSKIEVGDLGLLVQTLTDIGKRGNPLIEVDALRFQLHDVVQIHSCNICAVQEHYFGELIFH